MERDDLLPPIRVRAVATPDHYISRQRTGSATRWEAQVIGKIVVVQAYKQPHLSNDYHITNCPENDEIEFFMTRNAYNRKGMALKKKCFARLTENCEVKDVLSKLKED